MSNKLEHKGFIGSVEFSSDDNLFFGKIEGINDLILFEGSTVDELKSSFEFMVNEHIKKYMMNKTTKELLKYRDILQERVLNLIGYGTGNNFPIELDEDVYWIMEGDKLLFLDANEEPNNAYEECMYCVHTVSSYSSKGEKFYTGEEDGYTFVMAYPEDSSYEETTIFMLNNKKRHRI